MSLLFQKAQSDYFLDPNQAINPLPRRQYFLGFSVHVREHGWGYFFPAYLSRDHISGTLAKLAHAILFF